jgi:Fe-S cluster assembly protein SufD
MNSDVHTIARETIEDLALKQKTPSWTKDLRLASWEAYLQTPFPTTRDENWRRTVIESLDLSTLKALEFAPSTSGADKSFPACFQSVIKHFSQANSTLSGICYQGNGRPGYIELSDEAKSKGVIFCDIETALANHADLLQPYLAKRNASKENGKFALLTGALFNCGLFLYVPKNVELKSPFVSGIGISTCANTSGDFGGAIFPRLIVVAEPESNVSLVHLTGSADTAGDNDCRSLPASLSASMVDVFVSDGANVSFVELSQFAQNVYAIGTVHNEVARDGKFTAVNVALGGKQVKSDIYTHLQAQGAASEILGIVLGSHDEHYSFNTIQEHNAPDTKSDINFRVALKDNASSVYQGVIKVDKCAQKTDAYQSNKNLLLGAGAKADSIPRLEILADDVKCSHGATVGPVDPEQLFYLASRGLPEKIAEELIVLGFFKKVLDKLTVDGAADWLVEAVSQKIDDSGYCA